MHVHTTPATEEEATAAQLRLRAHVVLDSSGPPPGGPGTLVAGVDVAYDDDRGVVAAAAVLLDAATLAVTETATATGRVPFAYLPGLLAFRELPAVLDALGRLPRAPDLVVCDGYGIAHPRRFGLASHLGVLTGLPTIGVAKTPFVFAYAQPGPRRGDRSPLLDGDEVVGAALRTRDGVKPVFVSPGHRTTTDDACAHTLHLTTRGFRLPETTRAADHACRAALRATA
ncbi:endonuclease V [Streptomyces sp. NPDC049879]|uniref:endonuclease V n=1 Tax=Streptomyces sp. NPDC049879 TaxID=3365598 RepID=UPI0037AD2723